MADDKKKCSNCKHDIATSNFVMHEMHCRRHIVMCEHCDEPVHRSDLEQHFQDFHAKVPCEKCQHVVSKSNMAQHLAEECNRKMMKCEFCELSLPKNELEAHTDYCGSRTECCPMCQEYIMHKDMLRHESSGCTYPEPRPQPVPVDSFSMGDLQQLMTSVVLGSQSSAGASFRKGKIATNRKSELNAQRAKNILLPEDSDPHRSPAPTDTDYDTMLALQLAHEDWLLDGDIESDGNSLGHVSHFLGDSHTLEDFNGILEDGGEQWPIFMPSRPPDTGTLNTHNAHGDTDDEDMSIPCEFCEMEVPLSIYIAHVDSCPQAVQRGVADLNNEQVPPVQPITSRAVIPVINNLRPTRTSPEYNPTTVDDDIMLPCEFCQEMFPSDVIIHHQGVCQADGHVTPRATTPTWDHRPAPPQLSSQIIKQSNKFPHIQGKDGSLLNFVGVDGSDNSEELSFARVQKQHESSSNKYSQAYNRFDEAVTRPPRRSVRETSLGNRESVDPERESKSVQKTRASLNKLLQANTSPETNGTTRKIPGAVGLGGFDLNRGEPQERKSSVDSRTVMRHLKETRQKPAQAGRKFSQNTLNSPRVDQSSTRNRQRADANFSTELMGNRQRIDPNISMELTGNRQRTDHVFSPELRLKPNNNPAPKKR